MKKSKVIQLLINESNLSFNRIAKIVGCDKSYVSRISSNILKLPNRIPIMDFRGLLKGNICLEK